MVGTLARLHTRILAQASVTGYSEPAYTKTSTNNTFWWQWQAVDGLNLDATAAPLRGTATRTGRAPGTR